MPNTAPDSPYVPANAQLVVELFVRDIRKSLAFYAALDFQLERDAGDFAELSWEGVLLFLDQKQDQPLAVIPQANVRIMVPDVDERWEKARELGAPILVELGDRDYGLRDFTILDPDGFGIRFATLLEPA